MRLIFNFQFSARLDGQLLAKFEIVPRTLVPVLAECDAPCPRGCGPGTMHSSASAHFAPRFAFNCHMRFNIDKKKRKEDLSAYQLHGDRMHTHSA